MLLQIIIRKTIHIIYNEYNPRFLPRNAVNIFYLSYSFKNSLIQKILSNFVSRKYTIAPHLWEKPSIFL